MEDAQLGVELIEIAYKTRLIKSLTILLPITGLVILWVYSLATSENDGGTYWLPFFLFCFAAWKSWEVWNTTVIRKYEGMWVDSVDKKGKKTRTLTYSPNGAAAKAFDQQKAEELAAQPSKIDDFLESTLGRYLMAVSLGALALWIYTDNPSTKNVWIAGFLAIASACLMYEVLKWLIIIGIFIAVVSSIGSITLTVPVAIIIGAIIIAMSLNK